MAEPDGSNRATYKPQLILDDSHPRFESPRLCKACSAIFSLDHLPDGADIFGARFQAHHPEWTALEKAALSGCYICSVLHRHHASYRAGSGEIRIYIGEIPEVSFFPHHTKNGASWQLEAEYHQSSAETFMLIPQRTAQEMDIREHIPVSMSSTEVFEQARRWIHHCKINHPECSADISDSRLPARLVSIDRTSTGIAARLCDGHSLPRNTEYLTLSHCWGTTEFLTLRQNNKDTFYASIPVQSLTRTFQDAMYATAVLGFKYIWIDSLCIIQDTPNNADWEVEASKMCEVYKNATCNLAALAAPNGNAGILTRRNRYESMPAKVLVNWLTVGERDGTLDNIVYPHRYNYWRGMESGPLFERAWVFQEQLLAQRTLIFGENEVFWECSKSIGSEVWPSGMSLRFRPLRAPIRELFRVNNSQIGRSQIYARWRRLVQDYSRRKLSHLSDRLPAIQGIVAEFQRSLKDRYIYGLWEGDLAESLLWQSLSQDGMPPDYARAPSWSWASTNHEVGYFENGTRNTLCRITLQHNTASIDISGPLLPLDIKAHKFLFTLGSMNAFIAIISDGNLEWVFDIDKWHLGPLHETGAVSDSAGQPKRFEVSAGSEHYEAFEKCLRGSSLLHMIYEDCAPPEHSSHDGIVGLVLMPERSSKAGTFRRIGRFRVLCSSRGSGKAPGPDDTRCALQQYLASVRNRAEDIGPEFHWPPRDGNDPVIKLI